MDSQNIFNNNFGLVQQPVSVGLPTTQVMQQPLLMPPMAPLSFVPQVPQAPVYNVYQNIPGNADFWILTPEGMKQAKVSEFCNFQDGNYSAPQGWSLMPAEDYYKYYLNVIAFPANTEALVPFNTTPSVSSRSPSVESNVFEPRDLNMEPVERKRPTQTKKLNPKRPHRAKQVKITKVHTEVKENCVRKNIFADEREVLRGPDVLRIHVKTWEGLDMIQDVLDEIDNAVPIARIALPFSMKNKFQKKGFICYLKVQSEEYVDNVKEIFAKYSDAFKKCDVALPTNKDPVLTKETEDPFKGIFAPSDFGFSPPVMAKRMSAA